MIFQPNLLKIEDKSKIFFIYAIALILLFYGVSVGINITSFSLFLHQMGVPKSQIANILSMEIIGSLIAAPVFPKLIERYGTFVILTSALIIRAIAVMAFPMVANLKFNMICLLISGLGSFCVISAIWFWAASLLKDRARSVMIAIVSVAYSVGIAIGIATLFLKAAKLPIDLFKTSTLFSVIILAPIYLVKNSMPILPKGSESSPPSKLVKYMMIPIIAMLTANYLLSSYNNFGIVYAVKNNIPYNQAALINIYMLAGNLLLVMPAAILLDRIKNKHSFLSIILTIICMISIMMPFVIRMEYAPMFIFGALSSLIWLVVVYSISVVSSKFKGQNLLTATTILSVMHSIGGYVGVVATKASTQYWGNQGLIISTAIVALFVLLYVINTSSEG